MEEEIKIYVSCPITTSNSLRIEAIKLIEEAKGIPYSWEVGSFYIETIMDEATAVVVILPNTSKLKSGNLLWGADYSNIPKGTASEIKRAINRQLPVFLLYESSEGFFIYRVESTNQGIRGRAGTKLNLAYVISEEKKVREGKKKAADHAVIFGNGHAEAKMKALEGGWSGKVSSGGPSMQSIPVLPSKFEVWLAGEHPTLSIEDRNKLILII